jgi:hypothetical protein
MAKWAMRALLVLSAASMALAIAPPAGASGNNTGSSGSKSGASYSRYGNEGGDHGCDDERDGKKSLTSNNDDDCCNNESSSKKSGFTSNSKDECCNGQSNGTSTKNGKDDDDDDDCPHYTPPGKQLSAWLYKGDRDKNKVVFRLQGCPKGSDVTVKIDGVSTGKTFEIKKKSGILEEKVKIPTGAPGNELAATCSSPAFTATTTIQSSPPKYSFAPPATAKPLVAANPAKAAAVSSVVRGGSSVSGIGGSGSGTIPTRQLGFGLASVCGLIAFGGLRHRTRIH